MVMMDGCSESCCIIMSSFMTSSRDMATSLRGFFSSSESESMSESESESSSSEEESSPPPLPGLTLRVLTA